MLVYIVHEPPNGRADPVDRAERLVFIKDGFHWWAALVPPVWLLAKRLWLEFALYVGVTGLLVWGLSTLKADEVASAILLVVQIVFGFEAGAIYSAALERRGWRIVGTVAGRNFEDCERRFLETWLPTHTELPPVHTTSASPSSAWTATALARARSTFERGRRLIGVGT